MLHEVGGHNLSGPERGAPFPWDSKVMTQGEGAGAALKAFPELVGSSPAAESCRSRVS